MSSPRFAATPGTWKFTILLGALTAMAALAIDVLLPALPTMVREMGLSTATAQLTIGLFFAIFAVGQLLWGWLSDWLGRRPIILLGCFGYAVASLLCAYASDGNELLLWRGVQGLFAAASITVTRALVRDHFSGVAAARQIASMTTIFYLTPMIAPQIGTLLLSVAGWRSVFFFPAAFGGTLLVLSFILLAESHPPHRRFRTSFLNIFKTCFSMIKHVVSGPSIAIQICMAAGIMAWISSSSLILTGYYEFSELSFSLLFSATALVGLFGSILCNWLLGKYPVHVVLMTGLVFVVLSGCITFVSTVYGGPVWMVVAGIWTFFIAFGLTTPTTTGLALNAFGMVGGIAAACIGTLQSLSSSFGSSISAHLYDGTPSSLGICIGAAALVASVGIGTLSYRLRQRPDLLHITEKKAV